MAKTEAEISDMSQDTPLVARLSTRDEDFESRLTDLLAWEGVSDHGVQQAVSEIISQVRREGDAALVALTTAKGRSLTELARAAKKEIQRVVWPTRPETVQTTAIVLVAVLVVGLMLWLIDTLLGWAMSGVIG